MSGSFARFCLNLPLTHKRDAQVTRENPTPNRSEPENSVKISPYMQFASERIEPVDRFRKVRLTGSLLIPVCNTVLLVWKRTVKPILESSSKCNE